MSDSYLCNLLKEYFHTDILSCIPFYSINKKKLVYYPEALMLNLCGSNGGGAGNSISEAIGHGLDEIAERYAKHQIYNYHLTPPEISREYIKENCPELLDIIHEIERTGRFKIFVKDCSLGKGFPVVAVLMTDCVNHSYLANFGSHPQFAIALERCFTEMFQAYEIDNNHTQRKSMKKWIRTDSELLNSTRNWVSLLRDDLGFLPESFFCGKPDWCFKEWKKFPDYNNTLGMKYQIKNFLKYAQDIYIRSNSYFEIASFKVYIPDFSTTALPFNERHLHCMDLNNSLNDWLYNCRHLSNIELKDLLNNYFHPDMFMSGLSFPSMQEELWYSLYSALLYQFGEKEKAKRVLLNQSNNLCDVAVVALELIDSKSNEDISTLISMFYSEDELKFAKCWLDNNVFAALIENYVINHFSPRCKGEKDKSQKKINELHITLKKHMLEHPINQKEFGETLNSLLL